MAGALFAIQMFSMASLLFLGFMVLPEIRSIKKDIDKIKDHFGIKDEEKPDES